MKIYKVISWQQWEPEGEHGYFFKREDALKELRDLFREENDEARENDFKPKWEDDKKEEFIDWVGRSHGLEEVEVK